MPGIFNPRLLFLGFLLVLATIIVACGEEATTTAEPAPAAPEATAAAVPRPRLQPQLWPPPRPRPPAATPAPAVAAPTEAVMEGPVATSEWVWLRLRPFRMCCIFRPIAL